MRASHAEQIGSAGLHEVEAAFERLGWGPEAITLHDLGTDLWVQVRDEDRRDLGRLFGVQVRSGSSYFKEAVESDGEVCGWIFRDSDEHMRYWLDHSIPHVVVLHDPETAASYWVHINKDTAERTGEGWKALVPRRQTLTPACREALLSVAYSTPMSFEGSAWPATRPVLEQRRLWRHALLAPRLVAPHRNATPTSPITPVEGAAMVVLCHTRDLGEFAKKGLAPSIDAMKDHSAWGWRFVAALLVGGVDAIVSAAGLADSFEGVVAATVAASCAFAHQEDHSKALSLLRECLDKDRASSADRAWLLLQQARFLAETGEMLLARDAALEASEALASEPTDVTVSALLASASWILWRTSDWIARDLGAVVSAGDTAASWWQGQTLAGGLADFLRDSFEAWAEASGIHFRAENATLNSIDRVIRQSDYAGDQGTLAHSMGLKGMYRAMGASEDTVICEALDLLRRSGDSQLVEHAAEKLWAAGPLEGLRSAAQRIGSHSWTHSTGQTNLVLWRHAGDVMTEVSATSAVEFCLEALQDRSHAFYSRTTPQFLASTYLRRAVAGLLPAADDATQRTAASVLARVVQEANPDRLMDQDLAALLPHLRWSVLDSPSRDPWLKIAADLAAGREILTGAILRSLGAADANAAAMLAERAAGGDIEALLGFDDPAVLPQAAIARIVGSLDSHARQITTDATQGRWSFGSRNLPTILAWLNVKVPSAAKWDGLLAMLACPQVAVSDKAGACAILGGAAGELPEAVAGQLGPIALSITGTELIPIEGGPELESEALGLASALGAIGHDALTRKVAELTVAGKRGRIQAAMVIGHHPEPGEGLMGVLVGIAGDPATQVRAQAAAGIGLRIAAGCSDAPVLAAFLRLLHDDGASVPLAALSSLIAGRSEQPILSVVSEGVSDLSGHASASVRRGVQRFASMMG